MNCAECSHYHDLSDKLMCDAGLMEVTMVGNPHVSVSMTGCTSYNGPIVEWQNGKMIVSEPTKEKKEKIVDENLDKHK